MIERRFEVLDSSGDIMASNMSLDDACIFIEAVFNKYYRVDDMRMTIRVMDRVEDL